ncbi:hypothetical protein EIP75_21415 [Aquabacterium soli]|uniref:Uncharacterized protein n=1 Tax=Aquabacterium soli TaxID=2493092 RepID=A0A426V2V4_9BURK|nr:hypothetical protein [Aquabacterium soli]RRS01140.1 hypothetical protein EIP75_21415 [Aquabacterium soli]
MSEDSPTYHPTAAPSVDAILAAPDASKWLKDALRAALDRDPVDAANDAELLAQVLADRCNSLLPSDAG